MATSVFQTVVIGLCIWASMMGSTAARAADDINTLQGIRALVEAKHYQEAIERIDGYLAKNPGDAEGRFLKGIIFSDQEQFDKAIGIFVSLTKDYPQLPEPYNNLAVLYASRGEYPKARDALLVAIKTHPSYATAHENLGDIYAMMATEAYNKALELDKSNESVKIKLGMIRELFPEQVVAGGGRPAPGEEKAESSQQAPGTPIARGEKPRAPEGGDRAGQFSQPVVSQELKRDVLSVLSAWAEAWANKNVEGYLASYAPTFRPANGMSLPRWKAQRRSRILAPKFIEVTISEPRIVMLDNGMVQIHFIQQYRSNTYQDMVHKTMHLTNTEGTWRFIREETR